MNSIKSNLLQPQSSPDFPKNNTQKPCILSLIVLLTLVVAGILTVTTVIIIRESSPSISYTFVAPTPSQTIRAVCSFTPYKQLCRYTLSSSIFDNKSHENFAKTINKSDDLYKYNTRVSPRNIVFHSFQLGVSHLTNLSLFRNISKPSNIPESVLRECQVLLKKEISGLNDSAASAENLYSLRLNVEKYVEQFNKMVKLEQACLGRLEESGSMVSDKMRLRVQKMRRYTRNTRAILLNMDSIFDELCGRPSFDVDHYSYYSYYFQGLSYEYMVVCVSQYTFLILLLILMLKLY
ncbi:hypothetical protein POM88_038986 [Heracleum sosnowskyi]|uniref:Pectinesterase inhibitor domain-containing protein n=1 Tax=Heracleum sosnowskyi TaxID=360622 RepID=A0AAD8H9J8_9APIA|nr:hypothetical protein POM88_038986 [Heracleum sosnowskyi]